jgi:DNA-binding NarL/FixJ family response regulator
MRLVLPLSLNKAHKAPAAPLPNKVIEMTQQGRRQHDIAKTLNINKSNVSRHVTRAKQEGKLRSCVTQERNYATDEYRVAIIVVTQEY